MLCMRFDLSVVFIFPSACDNDSGAGGVKVYSSAMYLL